MTTQESREQEIKRLNTEKVKQIALCHFYSYYVRHNMSDMLAYVGEDVTWLGSQSNFVAHNRQEFENLLEREIEKVPKQCVMKVISADVSPVSGNCYQVTGELELRLPVQDNVYYTNLRFSMMICKEDGKFSIVSIHTSTIRKTALWHDTQALKERQKQFSEEGGENIQDPVTGVFQLGAFKERAARQLEDISKEKNYALICTDICSFERVNNLYGMQKADKLLADTAKMIMASGKCILLCCRSVADHFVALARYQDFSTFRNMLNELCNRFAVEIGNEYSDAYPRLGIGVYRIDKEHPPIQKMVEYANLARKSLRTNTTSHIAVYDERVYTQLIRAGKIEQSMKNAMAQHEFKAFIQPKYNLETGQIVGAEALVRWIREDGSMIYPDDFIPIFEKNGFIVELDFFILSEVCRMIQRRLQEKRHCVPISINQSRVLLQEKDYVKRVADILEKYDTPPRYIELELTERIFRDDLTDLAKMMGELRNLGVRWSIDDFGTGYSSLNLLKELPVDIIKIDKSFLDETESSETSKIIIRKTVELTQELDKTVVCEGVETENQADYLRGIRCDMAQGYLYAKPMPMEEFEKLLDKEIYG